MNLKLECCGVSSLEMVASDSVRVKGEEVSPS